MGTKSIMIYKIKLIIFYFILSTIFIFQSYANGSEKVSSGDYSLSIALLSSEESKSGDQIWVSVTFKNISNKEKVIQPFNYEWVINGNSCTFSYSMRPNIFTGKVYIMQPSAEITTNFGISGLSAPVFARGGYGVFNLPIKYQVISQIHISEYANIYSWKKIELNSNPIELKVAFSPEVTQVYQQLKSVISNNWEIVQIKEKPRHINSGFTMLLLNKSIKTNSSNHFQPNIATMQLFFIPADSDVDLPNVMNAFNRAYVDYIYQGSSSQHRIFGCITIAEYSQMRELIESYLNH